MCSNVFIDTILQSPTKKKPSGLGIIVLHNGCLVLKEKKKVKKKTISK